MMPDGVLSGSYSISQDDAAAPLRFQHVASDVVLLPKLTNNVALQRLQRFNQGYFIAREQDGKLIISDVRMGARRITRLILPSPNCTKAHGKN